MGGAPGPRFPRPREQASEGSVLPCDLAVLPSCWEFQAQEPSRAEALALWSDAWSLQFPILTGN